MPEMLEHSLGEVEEGLCDGIRLCILPCTQQDAEARCNVLEHILHKAAQM